MPVFGAIASLIAVSLGFGSLQMELSGAHDNVPAPVVVGLDTPQKFLAISGTVTFSPSRSPIEQLPPQRNSGGWTYTTTGLRVGCASFQLLWSTKAWGSDRVPLVDGTQAGTCSYKIRVLDVGAFQLLSFVLAGNNVNSVQWYNVLFENIGGISALEVGTPRWLAAKNARFTNPNNGAGYDAWLYGNAQTVPISVTVDV